MTQNKVTNASFIIDCKLQFLNNFSLLLNLIFQVSDTDSLFNHIQRQLLDLLQQQGIHLPQRLSILLNFLRRGNFRKSLIFSDEVF